MWSCWRTSTATPARPDSGWWCAAAAPPDWSAPWTWPGRAVTVVDQLPLESFASGMPYFPRLDLLQQLEQAGAVLLPEHTVTSFTDGGVQVSGADGAPILLPADTAIVALGVRPNNQLGQTLEAKYATGVRCVGDCAGGKNLYDATHSAYFAALSIV